MNVGDYVRTKNMGGSIEKIIEILPKEKTPDLVERYVTDISEQYNLTITKNDIIKSSPQIIDLIQCGDYVNGNCVIEAVPKDKRKKQIIIVDSTCVEYGDLPLDNEDIKTIVTHEQMEAMQYRVEE